MTATLLQEALWSVEHEIAITHESAHAAAALCLDLEVDEIRVDRLHLDADTRGMVKVRGRTQHPREFAVMVLCGVLSDPQQPRIDWPLVAYEGESSDEARLRELAEELELDRRGWAELHREALELLASLEFSRVEMTFRAALQRWSVLSGALLRRIQTIAREAAGLTPKEGHRAAQDA